MTKKSVPKRLRTRQWRCGTKVAAAGLLALGLAAAPDARAQEPRAKPDRGAVSSSTTPAPVSAPGSNSGASSAVREQDQPINIASDLLTVLQEENEAVFEGQVDAIQGTRRLRADKVHVHYEETRGADGQTSGGQSITKMRAFGNVVFISGGETAQGDRGVYDVRSGTIELFGKVVVSQGGSVLRGSHLVMDLNTGRSTLKADNRSKRVVGRFVPNSNSADDETENAARNVGN